MAEKAASVVADEDGHIVDDIIDRLSFTRCCPGQKNAADPQTRSCFASTPRRTQPHPATPNYTQPNRQGEVGLGRAWPGKVGRDWATCMFSVREHAVCLTRKPKTSYAHAGFKTCESVSFC